MRGHPALRRYLAAAYIRDNRNYLTVGHRLYRRAAPLGHASPTGWAGNSGSRPRPHPPRARPRRWQSPELCRGRPLPGSPLIRPGDWLLAGLGTVAGVCLSPLLAGGLRRPGDRPPGGRIFAQIDLSPAAASKWPAPGDHRDRCRTGRARCSPTPGRASIACARAGSAALGNRHLRPNRVRPADCRAQPHRRQPRLLNSWSPPPTGVSPAWRRRSVCR